jgi:hypothetical protein
MSFWFKFDKSFKSINISISCRFSSWIIWFQNICICWIYLFLSVILLICVFFILLVNLIKFFSILFISSKNKNLCFIDSFYWFFFFFVSKSSISALDFITTFHLLFLELSCFCFSKKLKHIFKLFIQDLSDFLFLILFWAYWSLNSGLCAC